MNGGDLQSPSYFFKNFNRKRIADIPLWFHETAFAKISLGLELQKADINLVSLADALGFHLCYRRDLHTTSRMPDVIFVLPLLKTRDYLFRSLLVNSPASMGKFLSGFPHFIAMHNNACPIRSIYNL